MDSRIIGKTAHCVPFTPSFNHSAIHDSAKTSGRDSPGFVYKDQVVRLGLWLSGILMPLLARGFRCIGGFGLALDAFDLGGERAFHVFGLGGAEFADELNYDMIS